MSLVAPLRNRVEAILCDGYGVAQTVAAGRFTRLAPDTRGDPPADAAERRVAVVCEPPRAPDGVVNNACDLFAYYAIPFAVQVYYVLTAAGGDLPEGLTSQDGSGEVDDVRDRAGTDAHDLLSALTYHENWSNLDPYLIDIGPAGTPALEERPQVAVLTMPFVATVRATRPGAYAP